MNSIQDELAIEHPQWAIQFIGVNEAGSESGNDNIIGDGRTLPWLQDVDLDSDGNSDVWTAWDVTYRDVIILDGTNWPVAVFNVTENNLSESAAYDALKQLVVDIASDVCRANGRVCSASTAATCP